MASALPDSSTSRRLYTAWRPYIQFYRKYAIKIQLLMLLKSILVIIPRSATFTQLRWLDCFLPGRILYGSRIPQASQYLATLTWLTFISNSKLFEDMGANFNFFCVEFILLNQRHKGHLSDLLPSKWFQARFRLDWAPPQMETSHSETNKMHPALQEFFRSQLDKNQLVQRPTRTRRWRLIFGRLHHLLTLTFMVILLLYCLITIFHFWPMFLTRRGFELTRENCVRHIVNSNASGASFYRFIYRPDSTRGLNQIYNGKPIPLVLPYHELVPLNLYHLLRIAFDILESCAALALVIIGYWYHLYFGILLSLDAIIYARDLRQKLNAASAQLWPAGSKAGAPQKPTTGPPRTNGRAQRLELPLQKEAISRLQASLIDYFQLIAFYNPVVSRVVATNVLIWLFYCFFIFLRHLRADRLGSLAALDNGVEIEFIALFSYCLLMALVLLGLASLLNAQAGKLYHSIVCLVALEQGDMRNRPRWIALLNHFEPQKLHCFTLFGYADLSWLTCLKLFSWVISALVILMTL